MMALPTTQLYRTPLLVVIGPTGSGKSRLAIDLATSLVGEVVNADVIQMYRGLDTGAAKVPFAERRDVPHHLMSFLEPTASFSVRAFSAVARTVIDDVAARGRLPIVVGGTMYYVQALLREGGSLEADEEAAVVVAGEGAKAAEAATLTMPLTEALTRLLPSDAPASVAPIVGASPPVVVEVAGRTDARAASLSLALPAASDAPRSEPGLAASATLAESIPSTLVRSNDDTTFTLDESPFARLCRVDPIMGERLHPRDARKIARALAVFDTTGVPYSQVSG